MNYVDYRNSRFVIGGLRLFSLISIKDHMVTTFKLILPIRYKKMKHIKQLTVSISLWFL